MHGIEEMTPGVAPIRTLVTTSTGWPSPVNRPASPEIVGVAHQMPTIADYIPQVQFDAQFAVWMEQILRTNNADGVAEGALKPESELSYVQRTAKLEKIAHWIPVTKEILKFGGPALRAEIEADMVNMLREKEEEKLLSGTGVSPQIQGFLTSPGIGTYARLAAENNLDALLKGFQSVRFTGRAEPDVVFVNPSNMTAAFLVKSTEGVPLYGNYADGALQTVFGKPYVQTTNMTLGTALTGAFSMYSQIRRAGFIDIEVGMHSDQFIRNCRTILVEEYLALIVKRASAFVTVTNLQ
jgi:HK97 family phage major capsid protein